ncbi:hypothetical protein SAMD00019534_073640 [Acytostelium subglobosum LB1]|uniref:hypothetical protein n=1 Tax=Acytostelium subglobosum LB1 TaxID=1410327 RepID=UPI000645077A|nr:hypothetical protein SAMD00019534_073640 [Acytostelium subglobosum LB1]GAM24189.1 hypothetical protein SAMD00019534_073640 [Acytostelium subglobosum LB1]|eukprot:XP_012752515.1 hypothetical protein SAMD00019534_073640 [Acytostelium subglobosum LB1]
MSSSSATEAVQRIFKGIAKQKAKGDNFYDVCFSLADHGVGHRITKKVWPSRNTYWTVTKISFGDNSGGRLTSLKGKAYGVLTWNGVSDMKERPVIDPLEKNWTLFPYTMPTKAEKEAMAIAMKASRQQQKEQEGEQS